MTAAHGSGAALAVPGLPDSSRLQRVLAAHRLVTADLSSAAMIDRLLLAAVSLTHADYGAVAVVSASGAVAEVSVHHAELADQQGWRDALEPRAVVPSPAERAQRARPGRLLGTEVRALGAVHLELYVGVQDPATFDGEAAALLSCLAELAGTAVENALLHEDAQRSKDWLQASGEIARALLSDADADTLLPIVLRALHVAEADSVGLVMPTGDGRRLTVTMAAGLGASEFHGMTIDADSSPLGRAVQQGESVLVADMSEVMRRGYVNDLAFGPVMATPLADARGVRGSIVLTRRRGRPVFTVHDLDLVATFADQLALALEMDDARLRGEWVTVLEERHRFAQDLHDNVMQRLFATGVGLQSLATSTLPPDVARRLGRYITDLDETIDEIRTRVFDLRTADGRREGPATSRFPRVVPTEV